ncbi:MAG: hypothetical protein M1486_02070 [Gammaproteobacteria bacterium]|nr:hypothetical protein [Gammaproteobacteria bacterium]
MGHNGKRTTQDSVEDNFGIPTGLVSKRRDEVILAGISALVAADEQETECAHSQESTIKKDATRLTHLTQSRPVIAHHRPPTRHTYYSEGIKTLFSGGSKEHVKEDSTLELKISLLDQVKQAVTLGTRRYQSRLDNADDARHEPGWFTNWRHGPEGLKNAETINNQINKCRNMDFVIIELTLFFFDSSRRYENNSLSMYLLDELNNLLAKHSYPGCKPEADAPYDKFTWIGISSQLKKLSSEWTLVTKQPLSLSQG